MPTTFGPDCYGSRFSAQIRHLNIRVTQAGGNGQSGLSKLLPKKRRQTKPSDGGQAASSPLRPPRFPPPRGGTSSSSSNARPLPRTAYSAPTSSFAGGRCGTPIFESIPGGGDVLLRAHHDAIVGGGDLLGAGHTSASKRQGLLSNAGGSLARLALGRGLVSLLLVVDQISTLCYVKIVS